LLLLCIRLHTCPVRFHYLAPFLCYSHHRPLNSFPTRRSSDLNAHRVVTPNGSMDAMICLHSLFIMIPPRNKNWTEIHLRTRYDPDRKSTRLNSSHVSISYAVFCLKKKKQKNNNNNDNRLLTYS